MIMRVKQGEPWQGNRMECFGKTIVFHQSQGWQRIDQHPRTDESFLRPQCAIMSCTHCSYRSYETSAYAGHGRGRNFDKVHDNHFQNVSRKRAFAHNSPGVVRILLSEVKHVLQER